MDHENIKAIKGMAPKNYKGSIELLGSYDPAGDKIIRDPYYVSLIFCFECLRCAMTLITVPVVSLG